LLIGINELRKNRNATTHRLQKELLKLADSEHKLTEAIKSAVLAAEVKDKLDTSLPVELR
jgi:hypothetical protein